jgi:hypothetical protein
MRPETRQRLGVTMNTKVLLASMALLAACAPIAEAGGIYMARSNDRIEFVQIVEAPDRSLAGSLTSLSINERGTLETKLFALTGAKEGRSLHLILKSGILGLGDAALVAEDLGDRIRLVAPSKLTGVASGTYIRATLVEFESASIELRRVAAEREAQGREAQLIRAAELRLEDSAKRLGSISREAGLYIQEHVAAADFELEIRSKYASLEAEMSRAKYTIDANHLDPLDRRSALIDRRNDLLDIEYRAKDIDQAVATAIAGHLASTARIRSLLQGFDGRCDVPRDNNAYSVAAQWVDRCQELVGLLPDVRDVLNEAEEVAIELQAVVLKSQGVRSALLSR